VVNDRADVASAAEASGVHVGQEDLEAEAARAVVGANKLLGVSTHNLEQFQRAADLPRITSPWDPSLQRAQRQTPIL